MAELLYSCLGLAQWFPEPVIVWHFVVQNCIRIIEGNFILTLKIV